jgi:hypothetical protein
MVQPARVAILRLVTEVRVRISVEVLAIRHALDDPIAVPELSDFGRLVRTFHADVYRSHRNKGIVGHNSSPGAVWQVGIAAPLWRMRMVYGRAAQRNSNSILLGLCLLLPRGCRIDDATSAPAPIPLKWPTASELKALNEEGSTDAVKR